jgi:hypothetical protein
MSAAFDLILAPASGIELLRSSGISFGMKTGGASFVGLSGGCGITAAASILLIAGSAMSALDGGGDDGVIKLSLLLLLLLLLELNEGDWFELNDMSGGMGFAAAGGGLSMSGMGLVEADGSD